MNVFKKFRASLRLYEAVRQADKAHNQKGERYYVMPTGNMSGQLIIMDRDNFRKLKQKGYIDRKVFVKDLERECFYCTAYRNGTGVLSNAVIEMKRKEYFSWLNSLSNAKRNGKVRKH